jgi:hypothetical protein
MNRLIVSLVVSFSLLAATAMAADASVVLCFPGGPGSTDDAQPVVDRFMAKLSKQMGWKKAKGAYFNQMSACKSAYKDRGATVVMLSLNLFLENRAAWKLTPVAVLTNSETSGQFHIVSKRAACENCLTGQTVATGLKASDRFLSKVAFDGRIAVGKDFQLKRTRSPIRAIKSLVRDKVIAAIVNDIQMRSLKGLPGTSEIKTILSGPKLPGAIVASVGKASKGLQKALLSFCKTEKALCKEMRITGFGKVNSVQLKSLGKKLR